MKTPEGVDAAQDTLCLQKGVEARTVSAGAGEAGAKGNGSKAGRAHGEGRSRGSMVGVTWLLISIRLKPHPALASAV